MERLKPVLIYIAFIFALYTQFAELTEIPGLHFDEAWQGQLAAKIAAEEHFWPSEAMNSYTSPIVHYLLAGVFKMSSPSMEAMRGFYACLNLVALGIFAFILWRRVSWLCALIFTLGWALLPLSIHNHRFYVEMTGFFGFCLALQFFLLDRWGQGKTLRRFGPVLFGIVTLVGAYSHILYIAAPLALWFTLYFFDRNRLESFAVKLATEITCVGLLPLFIRMLVSLKKGSAGALLALDLLLLLWSFGYLKLPVLSAKSLKLLSPLVILYGFFTGFIFIVLMWGGAWPYAQATGSLSMTWAVPNALVIFLCVTYFLSKRPSRSNPLFLLFSWTVGALFLASIMSFKPTPRYLMLPFILSLVWVSIFLSQRNWRILFPGILIFSAFNFAFFQLRYLQEFGKRGPTDASFRFLSFNDSGRDFRPFQKPFRWLKRQNCHFEIRWFEDDRFKRPVEFLRLTAPKPTGLCPWNGDDTFFAHTPWPTNLPLATIAHEPDWGDLAIFLRKK